MNLPELNILQYSQELSSPSPTPGGGAATGLAASQGASLVAMVCNLTIGKEKYAVYQDDVADILDKAMEYQQEALVLMDKDAESFGEVGKVYQMPKESEQDKALRKEAMEKALKGCTMPPMALMELSVAGLTLTQSAIGKTTDHAVSDLGVAALFFKSALEGAWLNVRINVAYIQDAEFCSTYEHRGKALLEQGCPLADEIYRQVLEGLQR